MYFHLPGYLALPIAKSSAVLDPEIGTKDSHITISRQSHVRTMARRLRIEGSVYHMRSETEAIAG